MTEEKKPATKEELDAKKKEEEAQKKAEEEAKKQKELEAEKKKRLESQIVAEGDMIKVDILGKTIEADPTHNVVFQASNPEDAKMLPNYDEKKSYMYAPDLAIIGKKGFVQEKVDEAMKGMKFFEEKVLKLEPKDAFGERKGDQIEKMNVKKVAKEMGEEPKLGGQYRDKKGNRQGTIIHLAQGRCLVDFNHPLAGKTIEYKIKIVDKIETVDEKVNAFVERRFPGLPPKLFAFKHIPAEKTAEIEIPQFLELQVQGQNLFYEKYGLSMDLQEHIPDVETVKFVQIFKKIAHDHDHEGEHDHEHEEKAEEKKETKEEVKEDAKADKKAEKKDEPKKEKKSKDVKDK